MAKQLYRTHTARLQGGHWGTITAEPAVLDCGSGRHIVIRNGGPDPLYLSGVEGGPADRTIDPPGDDTPAGEVVIRDHTFLRSRGQSMVVVDEFYGEPAPLVDDSLVAYVPPTTVPELVPGDPLDAAEPQSDAAPEEPDETQADETQAGETPEPDASGEVEQADVADEPSEGEEV